MSANTTLQQPVAKSRGRLVAFLFLATVFSVSFQNVYWNVAGRVNLADILALLFIVAFVAGRVSERNGVVPSTTLVVLGFGVALLVVYLFGFFNLETNEALSLYEKGLTKFLIHFLFVAAGIAYLASRSERFYWRTFGWYIAGFAANAAYGLLQLAATLGGRNLDALVLNPITGGAASINIWGAVGQSSVYRVNALTGDANHLGVMLVVPLLLLTPVYLRLERGHRLRVPLAVLLGFLLLMELSTLSRSALLGLLAGGLLLAVVYRSLLLTRALLVPLGAVAACHRAAGRASARLLLERPPCAAADERHLLDTSFPGLRLHSADDPRVPAVRLRAEHVLGLLRVRHRPHAVGGTFLLRRDGRRDRARRDARLRALPRLHLQAARCRAGDRARVGSSGRPRGRSCPPARLGADRGARRDDRGERLLPDDAVLLLLRPGADRAGDPDRLRPPAREALKVAVLTTSYPRHADDAAGLFVADQVERIRERGVDVEVVSPASFRHYGIAYGSGVAGNLRSRPYLALALPLMLGGFARAARRAAHDADLVHAHWLPAGAVAMTTGKPFVVQVWGTDVELALKVPALARRVLRRARLVISPSTALADEARRLGAQDVRTIPSGIDVPDHVGEEDEPAHVLYAGRLSPEKGIRELVAAADGHPLVVAGDGPLRSEVPGALGFVPHDELERLYERAAVVACPSHREGFGIVCAEAMAHGRPVVAGDVGGLRDLVVDEVTGLLVPPRDAGALRAALERLLADPALRRRMGEAGRARISEHFTWQRFADETLRAYEDALAKG